MALIKGRREKATFYFEKEQNIKAYLRAVVVEPPVRNKSLESA